MICTGCQESSKEMASAATTFGEDLAFLSEHTGIVVLSDSTGRAKVAVGSVMQGRVLTSTAQGDDGLSFGWINRDLIASGERQEHMNAFGGEDRFWLGPEGGQYSIYFAPGTSFTLNNWYVPAEIDWDPFNISRFSDLEVALSKDMQLTNYSGTTFNLRVERTVGIVNRETVELDLGIGLENLDMVAFESWNSIMNTGTDAWTPETGLLSIWILGMFTPTPETTVIIPFIEGSEDTLGPVVNADYFGVVPAERLIVGDRAVFFKGDGLYRSKIGLSYARSISILGSYDARNEVLTLVQYTRPEESQPYVNSKWELQEFPYSGDVINSYNDGPPEPGVPPLGPFYELETSSPAVALIPGEWTVHLHRTIHLQGNEQDLDPVARHALGYGIDEIVAVFGQ